jgi:hypothetical protein
VSPYVTVDVRQLPAVQRATQAGVAGGFGQIPDEVHIEIMRAVEVKHNSYNLERVINFEY